MRFSLASLILVSPVGAMAQALPNPSAEIIVTGRALPPPPGVPAYSVSVISRERLENSASNRIETILGDVAGFQQFRRSDSRSANPSAQGATLRALGGNAATRALVLLDGVPLADPFFGSIPFNALVPDRLSSVTVQRGGGSGAFGAGAVAGVIDMTSASKRDLPLLSASAFYGSRNALEGELSVTPSLGDGFASLSGQWARGDGFQTTPAAQLTPASVPAAYQNWSTNLRAVAPLAASAELQFRASLFHDNRTLRFAGADSVSDGQDASILIITRGRWQLDALAYLQARNFANTVISATTFRRSLDQRNTPSTGIGGKIELRPPVGADHVLRLGIDTRFAQGTMVEDAYNANLATNPLTARRTAGGAINTSGAFIEDDWTRGGLVLTGGVRADHWAISNGFFRSVTAAGIATMSAFADRSAWQASARGGLLWRIAPAVALRSAAYTGFRVPTLNELYRPFTVFPVTTQANAGLVPETLKGAEAGLDLTPAKHISFSATLFYNRLDDAIANVSIAANLNQRQNVRAIVAQGVELEAHAQHGPFTLTASYAYTRSRVSAPGKALDGLTPAQTPSHAASATLGWNAPKGAALALSAHYVSSQYEDDLQTSVLPEVLTIDGVVRVPLAKGLALTGRVENMFNATVITRNVAGSLDLGTPRTFWLGLKWAR